MAEVLFILGTEGFLDIRVGMQAGGELNRKRFGVVHRIVDGEFDLQVAEIAPAEALGHMRRFASRMAECIQQDLVVQSRGLNHQSARIPPSHRIPQPRRIGIGGKLASISVYMAVRVVALVEDHYLFRRLDDFEWHRDQVGARNPHRQTMAFRINDRALASALSKPFGGLWPHRCIFRFEVGEDVEKVRENSRGSSPCTTKAPTAGPSIRSIAPPGGGSTCQTPERSGWLLEARGAGADRFTSPSRVRGTPGSV